MLPPMKKHGKNNKSRSTPYAFMNADIDIVGESL